MMRSLALLMSVSAVPLSMAQAFPVVKGGTFTMKFRGDVKPEPLNVVISGSSFGNIGSEP